MNSEIQHQKLCIYLFLNQVVKNNTIMLYLKRQYQPISNPTHRMDIKIGY
jgi:hypothetical protein